MMPVFPIRLILLVIPVVIAAVILGVGSGRSASGKGGGFCKKQGVAWVITGVIILCAIGIGYAKAPFHDPVPDYPSQTVPPAGANSFVWDEAGVLSSQTVRTLDERNQELWERYQVSIGVVTCNYGRDDLDEYAMKCAEEMGLGGYDMIVALDISGDNYWLIQGNDIRRAFTDQDCSDYAYDYMEDYFARGMYDDAVLDLTLALEAWYANYYGHV